MKKILGWTLMAPEDGDGGAGGGRDAASAASASGRTSLALPRR